MQTPSFDIDRFLGLNDQNNPFNLKRGECTVFDNWIVQGDTMEKRPGYTPRIVAAYAGAPKVTGLGGFKDATNTRHFLATMGGKLLEDVAGTWTERAAGLTLSSTSLTQIVSAGSVPAGASHQGNVVVNDQVNPPLIWSGSGVASILNADITRASCCCAYRDFFLLGDYTSTSEGRSICTVSATLQGNPQLLGTAKTPTNRNGQVIALVPTSDYVLIFLEDALWWGVFNPAADSTFLFDWKPLDPGMGIVGPEAAVNVPGKITAFWGRGHNKNGGPYIIDEKNPAVGPTYIGGKVENFIAGLDSNYLSGIVAEWLPNFNCVMFHGPFGSSQATNNAALIYNVTDGTWAVWKNDAVAFAFASAASVIDTDGTYQLYGGGYNGLVHKLGNGLQDNGQGYRSEAWTGWLGDGKMERDWLELVLRMDLGTRKIIQIKARFLGGAYEDSEEETGGAAGDPIGGFTIGLSAIEGVSVGQMVGDIEGSDPSTHVMFGIIDEQDNVACRIHGLTTYFIGGSSWVAPAA